MRLIKCDVCDNDFEPDEELIEMAIPAVFLEQEGEPIHIDVCSWFCFRKVGQVFDKDAPKPEQTGEEEAEQFIDIPETPMVDADMTAQMLAEYTEAVTGVKRRM